MAEWLDIWSGIWDNVWGVLYDPIDSGDTEYYNTQIEIYDDVNPQTLLDVLHARFEPTCLSELRAHGGGSFQVSKRDPKILKNPSLISYRKYVKIRMNGIVVGGFVIQTKKTVIVGAGEEADEMWELSGEGPRSWSRDAAIYPALGLKSRSADTRYFNFATEAGSWYDPDQWDNASVIYNWNAPGNWWATAPAEWPDAPSAKWIWDRTGPYAMPQGYVFLRKEFTVPTAASHSLFIAVDDTAEVYVDGELLLTTSEHSWQETSRIDMDLEAGNHVIGVKAYNSSAGDAPGAVLAAFFKFGDPLVPSSAQLLFVSDGTWKVQGYPSVDPGWTIGDVLLTLLSEAETRGVRFATNWTPTFTESIDSSGVSWGDPIPFSFTVGATYEEAISAIEELGCDIYVDPGTLEIHAWRKRGTDRSVSSESAPWVERRRNLAKNPRQVTGGSTTERGARWSFVPSYVTQTWHPSISTATRFTAPDSTPRTSGVDFGQNYDIAAGTSGGALAYPVLPGSVISVAAWAENSGYSANARINARFHDGAGNWIAAATIGSSFDAGTQGVQTFSVPAGATYAAFRLEFITNTSSASHWFEYTGIQIEASPSIDFYFDGDTLPAREGDSYSWVGLQYGSASIFESRQNDAAIIFSPGHNLLSAEETGQAEIANTLMLHAKDGWQESAYADTTSLSRYGRVETQLSTQLSSTSATPLIQELFRTKSLPEKSATFEIVPVLNMIPFVDFQVGDIVSAPGEVPDVYESRRVMSISFSEDSATGKPQFSLEFDTIFKDRQSELEKWVSRISNSSALGGGFTNSSTLPPTSQQGQPGSLLGNVPDAPTGLSVSSIGKFAEDGTSSSDYSLTWNPVVTGSGFGTVTITQYEVWGHLSTETEDQLIAIVFDTFAFISGFRPGDEWVFKVRAISRTGGAGGFSSEVALVAANPAIVLGQPSTPVLTSSMGTVTINWDGLIEGLPAPGYVRYVRVERTGAGSPGTWEEERRNAFANPRAIDSLIRFGSDTFSTLSLVTDMPAPTTSAARSTRTGSGDIMLVGMMTGLEMIAGTSFRSRFRVRSSHALTDVKVYYRTDIASATDQVLADNIDVPVGVSYIDVESLTHVNAPTTTAGVALVHDGSDTGATLDVTDILIEKMPSDGTMVSGDIVSGNPDERYVWLGTPNDSISVFEVYDPWVAVSTLIRGSTVDASPTTGKSYDYRLIAIDTYGGESDPSDRATITVEGVQSGDITGGLASQNLIANGSFEEDFSSWLIKSIYPNGGSSAEVVTGGIAGAKYLRLIRGSEIPGGEVELSVAQSIESFIPISSVGAYGYFVSAKVAASAPVAGGFSLRVYWYQGDKVTLTIDGASTVVDSVDVSTTAQYFVGQVFPPADARFMQVAVISTQQNSTIYVDDVVAREVISQGMIGQGAITAPHLSAGSVTANALQAGSVTADALAAGSILADKIAAGAIQTTHISADVGASLDISSNASVNILVNRTDLLEGDLSETQNAITDLQTYYSFTAEGAIIGKTDSAFKLFLKNDRIEILENNVVTSYWDSGQMVVKRFIGEEVVLANHKIEKYTTGTVVKKV